jgi:hypothetical protein
VSTASRETQVVRVAIDDRELMALRRRAIDLELSVPALLALLVRRELEQAASEQETER